MKIDYDTPYNTSTPNDTITGKENNSMKTINDIKALTPGEWLHLIMFGSVITVVYIVAEYMY